MGEESEGFDVGTADILARLEQLETDRAYARLREVPAVSLPWPALSREESLELRMGDLEDQADRLERSNTALCVAVACLIGVLWIKFADG